MRIGFIRNNFRILFVDIFSMSGFHEYCICLIVNNHELTQDKLVRDGKSVMLRVI